MILRVALAQINTVVGDLAGNRDMIARRIEKAKSLGADLIVFPELAITGYPPEDLLLKPDFVEASQQSLLELLPASQGITAVVGCLHVENDLYNAAAILHDGTLIGFQHKQLLPNYGVFDENRYFNSGEQPQVFQRNGVTFGVSICEDIWYGNGPSEAQASGGGAELLINISASPYSMRKGAVRERMIAARAMDSTAFVAYCNLVGGQDELIFDGQSLICGPQGELIARGVQFSEDLLVADLDFAQAFRARLSDPRRRKVRRSPDAEFRTIPLLEISAGVKEGRAADVAQVSKPAVSPISKSAARRKLEEPRSGVGLAGLETCDTADLEVCVTAAEPPACVFRQAPSRKPTAIIQPTIARSLDRVEEVYEALVLGVRDYVRKNGFQKVVLGLSGGVDSALTATLAADALGAENVTGVALPTRYSSAHSLEDAEMLARNLGLHFRTIPIDGMFQSFLENLAPVFVGRAADLTEENLQPRIRGTVLMALSNKFGWLVLTTGNKSETGVGYSTLYGDTAGGFAVLKDVPKMLVYELCRARNERAGRDLIPQRTLDKAPSAELRPDQKDTDSLPDYAVLDPILQDYVEENRPVSDIVRRGFDEATVRRVVRLVDRNEYKRRQSPPGVKITHRAFGKDWRLPMTNRYESASGPSHGNHTHP